MVDSSLGFTCPLRKPFLPALPAIMSPAMLALNAWSAVVLAVMWVRVQNFVNNMHSAIPPHNIRNCNNLMIYKEFGDVDIFGRAWKMIFELDRMHVE